MSPFESSGDRGFLKEKSRKPLQEANMKMLEVRNTDIKVSPINLGGNVFGWTLDEKQSFRILDEFTEHGFNFLDTADMYSFWVDGGAGGQSETIIGKWMSARKNRENLVIATKVGGETGNHPIDISKSHILKSIDESLKRLQTDYIDLYYTHWDDNTTPVEETLSAYAQIIEAGKVRYIAASNISPRRLNESMEMSEKENLPRYVALQPHYNLVYRSEFETDYAPLVSKYNFSVFPYWSLESGFLTGKYRTEADFDTTERGPGIKKFFDDRGKAILSALDSVAEKHKSKPAAVALAWLMANPLVTAPIASATSSSQLDTLVSAVRLSLDSEDIKTLNSASQPVT